MLEHIADCLPMFGVAFFETSDSMINAVLANGCYRWLASQLHGFDQSKSVMSKLAAEIGVRWKIGANQS